MGIFDRRNVSEIDRGVEQFSNTPGAILLDVRRPEEYREGHIPGSFNLPLQEIEQAGAVIERKDRPLFVYCRSGVRSAKAVQALQSMGYSAVVDLGGIIHYHGELAR